MSEMLLRRRDIVMRDGRASSHQGGEGSASKPHRSVLTLGLAGGLLALSTAALAQTAPPPPTADQVKACVQQIDLSKQWTFDWKTIEVGQPRHPRNAYERAGLAGDADFGYPVHVVYVFNHGATVDATYWMTHDTQNRWWIVAVCRPRR